MYIKQHKIRTIYNARKIIHFNRSFFKFFFESRITRFFENFYWFIWNWGLLLIKSSVMRIFCYFGENFPLLHFCGGPRIVFAIANKYIKNLYFYANWFWIWFYNFFVVLCWKFFFMVEENNDGFCKIIVQN